MSSFLTTGSNMINRSYVDNSCLSSMTKGDMSYDTINLQFKVILLGDVGVGKTTIFERYVHFKKNEVYNPTISANVDVKAMVLNANTHVQMQIFDTAGQEIYRSTTKNYIIGAKGIIIVYSIIDEISFKVLKDWIKIVEDTIDIKEATIFVVGNKIDRDNERKVSSEVAEKFAKENNFLYIEISAQEGMNVDRLFEQLAVEMTEKAFADNEASKNNGVSKNGSMSIGNSSKGFGGSNQMRFGNSLLTGKGIQKKNQSTFKKQDANCC